MSNSKVELLIPMHSHGELPSPESVAKLHKGEVILTPAMIQNLVSDTEKLGNKAFSIIELVEVAGVPKSSFEIIRKKLLNLGNDIKRLSEKVGE